MHRIGEVLSEVVDASRELISQVGFEAVIPDQVVGRDMRRFGDLQIGAWPSDHTVL